MNLLDRLQREVSALAKLRGVRFSLRGEPLNDDDFFDLDSGFPLACLPGLNLAKACGWPDHLTLLSLRADDSHAAGCAISINSNVNPKDINTARFATISFISQGFAELTKILKPELELDGAKVYSLESIAMEIQSGLDRPAGKVIFGENHNAHLIEVQESALKLAMEESELSDRNEKELIKPSTDLDDR